MHGWWGDPGVSRAPDRLHGAAVGTSGVVMGGSPTSTQPAVARSFGMNRRSRPKAEGRAFPDGLVWPRSEWLLWTWDPAKRPCASARPIGSARPKPFAQQVDVLPPTTILIRTALRDVALSSSTRRQSSGMEMPAAPASSRFRWKLTRPSLLSRPNSAAKEDKAVGSLASVLAYASR